MSDCSWRLLYIWYTQLKVYVRWNGLGGPINISNCTRQGGLTSTHLFNCFYKDLIKKISCTDGGIDGHRFSVYCYADDLLLDSTRVTGLQSLIDSANSYMIEHGLSFNSAKTTCLIYGKNPFTERPQWQMNNQVLNLTDNLSYLGAILGNRGDTQHCHTRASKCRKSFFALQGSGLCDRGLEVNTKVHVWSAACQSLLSYACESIFLSNNSRAVLDRLQAKLVKCMVGLGPYYRTKPLLQALGIPSVSNQIDTNSLILFKNILAHNTAARKLNLNMLKLKPACKKLLINRVKNICDKNCINFLQFCVDDNCFNTLKRTLTCKVKSNGNGIVDTIRVLFSKYNCENKKLLKLILKAF